MFSSRIVRKKVKIAELFEKYQMPTHANATKELKYKVNVRGKGDEWNRITHIFRTDLVDTCTVYFRNNKTVKCSTRHRFMTQRGWVHANELISGDRITTATSSTEFMKIVYHAKQEVLYDISVENTHEYLSNGVLSHNSWLLAKIGASALLSGKTVLHYTLELSEDYTGWRYDCILSGISLDKIKNHKEDVKKKLMEIKENSGGDLIIKEYPTKSISLMGIRSHITKLKMLGTSPDIVVIDYADLLKFGNSTMAKHEALEQLYEEIRGFAGELQIPIWTVSQSNKSGLDGDIVEAESAAGAYAKIFTADFVMSLSRKAQDKLSNTGRIHIIKNRFGVDGITFPVFMDPSRGAIDIFAAGTDGARNATNQMQTDSQYNRQRLKQRYQQINGNFPNIENKNVEF